MATPTTRWRVSPVAWLPITLAIVAESVSNSLRAYGLGSHLDRFTVSYQGYTVSLAGAVLVLAAVAVSLSQARAAWVALTPGRPGRQRFVAGLAAALLLAISITAMASHILEAQRAKVGDEAGLAKTYERAEAAYKRAEAELKGLGEPRAVSVIQAEVQAVKIDMRAWRASDKCSDITKEDTKRECAPVLELYKERGAAARKTELEPEVARLRAELASMQRPVAVQSSTEETVGLWWAWIMGVGVVFVATFGTVIFATAETVVVAERQELALPPPIDDNDDAPLSISGKPFTRDDALADLKLLLKAGHVPESQDWLTERWGVTKGATSRWLSRWEADGSLPARRVTDGRYKTVVSA